MPTEITNYQCPACTGPLRYDGESGKLICDYCGSTYTPAEVEALFQADNQAATETHRQAEEKAKTQGETVWGPEAENLRAYNCPSCGAQLLCEATTAATRCPYCGNPTVIPGKLAGMLKPDYVIPFKLDKNAAISALRRHYQKKPLLPKAFTEENHVQEIQGVYVPFWLFDGEAQGEATFRATRSHVRRSGNTEITTTDHFNVRRGGSMSFSGVPADGSTKMPDSHMDAIEPFNYEELKPFSLSYLPGFLADRYDVDADTAYRRVKERMENTLLTGLQASAAGYHTCVPITRNAREKRTAVRYALLPVWMLHTRWQGKDYLFAMNGQTGKLVGDLPVSWGRFWAWFGGVFAGTAAVLTLLSMVF